MSRLFRFLPFVVSIGVFAAAGCGGTHSPSPHDPTAKTYQIVTVSDLHFNPFYDMSLAGQLLSNPASKWNSIFQTSKVLDVNAAGADTNYPLLQATLASVTASLKQNAGNSPVVLITGDLLGHGIPAYVCGIYYAPSQPPSTCTATPIPAVSQLINQVTNDAVSFLAAQIHDAAGGIPVIYTPGNIDTYLGSAGPSPEFLNATASTVYTQLLNSPGNQSTFSSTYSAGGYYSVQPLGSGLLVIALNSNSFVEGSPTFAGAPTEIQWLNQQLQSAKAAGQKVWILMHVPPGANSQLIAQTAVVPSNVDKSDASMLWDPGLQSSFFSTLGGYPGLVTMMLAGHTHMDEFRLMPTGDVLEQLPGISPCFGNNPAFKIIAIRSDNFTATDYQSWFYNLSAAQPGQFSPLYQFSTTYAAQGATLATALQQLYPQLNSTGFTRDTYSLLYASGTTAINTANNLDTPWNPINAANWPIFGCTIGYSNQSDYLDCLTSY